MKHVSLDDVLRNMPREKRLRILALICRLLKRTAYQGKGPWLKHLVDHREAAYE